jgi:hypothetical protein
LDHPNDLTDVEHPDHMPIRYAQRRHALLASLLAVGTFVLVHTAMGQQDHMKLAFHPQTSHYPTVPQEHAHMRLLLDNAFRYIDPRRGLIDPASGYPVEGWNQEPRAGVYLRSFTQLTAIGAWVELLANIAAGQADNPFVSRQAALEALSRVLDTLLVDQHDPALSAKGLLVNFIGLEHGTRQSPLVEAIDKDAFVADLGPDGDAIWAALVEAGWLSEEDNGQVGRINRSARYGANHFHGPLRPFAEEPTRSRIMEGLDRRTRTIIFGDNANLTAALARAAGALLGGEVRDDPEAIDARIRIGRFIDNQREGYTHLFDPTTGTFVFGWDASLDRFTGWDDAQGHWVTGQMNYFINEFRGPWTFVALRYDLPLSTIGNAGFKIKPYRMSDGRDTYALAAWDGSAFQLLGLALFMQEQRNPGWRRSLDTLVDIELDYSTRHGLPGLLSEAYSGKGAEYTGLIGIPDLAVTDMTLNTEAPSLYTLGVAYALAPERVEPFLADHWPMISRLLTEHGPWEGWNTASKSITPYQTTAHTLALILGALNTGQQNMARYLAEHGLSDALEALYAPGTALDLLRDPAGIVPWTSDGSGIDLACDEGRCRFASRFAGSGGLVFTVPDGQPANLSNGTLSLRYASTAPIADLLIGFARTADDPRPPMAIPVEIQARLPAAAQGEITITLPATPALSNIREVALTIRHGAEPTAVDLTLDGFAFAPFPVALEPAD